MYELGMKRLKKDVSDAWGAYRDKRIDSQELYFNIVSITGTAAGLLEIPYEDAFAIVLHELEQSRNKARLS